MVLAEPAEPSVSLTSTDPGMEGRVPSRLLGSAQGRLLAAGEEVGRVWAGPWLPGHSVQSRLLNTNSLSGLRVSRQPRQMV